MDDVNAELNAMKQLYETTDGVIASLVRQNERTVQHIAQMDFLLQELNRNVKLLRQEQKELRDQLAVMQAGGPVL